MTVKLFEVSTFKRINSFELEPTDKVQGSYNDVIAKLTKFDHFPVASMQTAADLTALLVSSGILNPSTVPSEGASGREGHSFTRICGENLT